MHPLFPTPCLLEQGVHTNPGGLKGPTGEHTCWVLCTSAICVLPTLGSVCCGRELHLLRWRALLRWGGRGCGSSSHLVELLQPGHGALLGPRVGCLRVGLGLLDVRQLRPTHRQQSDAGQQRQDAAGQVGPVSCWSLGRHVLRRCRGRPGGQDAARAACTRASPTCSVALRCSSSRCAASAACCCSISAACSQASAEPVCPAEQRLCKHMLRHLPRAAQGSLAARRGMQSRHSVAAWRRGMLCAEPQPMHSWHLLTCCASCCWRRCTCAVSTGGTLSLRVVLRRGVLRRGSLSCHACYALRTTAQARSWDRPAMHGHAGGTS